jgi:hypothetical protein
VLLPIYFLARRRAEQPGQRQRLKHGAKRVYERFNLVGSKASANTVSKA